MHSALAGGRKMALDALLEDPVTSARLETAETEALLDEMMEPEKGNLPQFE